MVNTSHLSFSERIDMLALHTIAAILTSQAKAMK